MNPIASTSTFSATLAPQNTLTAKPPRDEGREAFQQFVGETVFGQMLATMRKSCEKAPYFHGGRSEEVFQGQLDQELAKEIAKSSAQSFSDPMYELFMLQRQ